VRLDLSHLAADIAEVQGRIKEAFYANLFLMMAESDRREITAREIDERREEKMLMLGPVLERLHDELLQPLVARVFRIMARNGLIPPPPPSLAKSLDGNGLRVEFISILTQARKSVTTRKCAQPVDVRDSARTPCAAISFGIDHPLSLAVEGHVAPDAGCPTRPVPNPGGAMHTSTRRTSMSACPASILPSSIPRPTTSEWPS
jgi:hypothetical protein